MSAQINDGGPAFPSSNTPDHGFYAEGMSMRDYFAAKAMQAYLSSYPQGVITNGIRIDDIAADAWDMADAMLAARAKGGAA